MLQPSRYLRKNRQRQSLYEKAEFVAEWQDLLHITRGLLQKLKSYVNHALCGCVKTLERAAESCHNFYFSRVVRDGCIESAPAHFPVLYLCIPCSRHERLREVCHMAAVIETKTESTLHYDLLQLVFPTQILFLR